MNNYYFFSWKHLPESFSAIYAIENQVSYELIPQLEGKKSMPFDFELKKCIETENGIVLDSSLNGLNDFWLDYLPNSLAWPLMSERLKEIIDCCLTGKENLDWISCNVKGNNQERNYFIPRFNLKHDVLDFQKTLFVPGKDHIIKPVYAISKIQNYSIFPKPLSNDLWRITSDIYICEQLKKLIQNAGLKGITLEKVTVSG